MSIEFILVLVILTIAQSAAGAYASHRNNQKLLKAIDRIHSTNTCIWAELSETRKQVTDATAMFDGDGINVNVSLVSEAPSELSDAEWDDQWTLTDDSEERHALLMAVNNLRDDCNRPTGISPDTAKDIELLCQYVDSQLVTD